MPTGGGFGFGPFRVDVRARQLFRDGQFVALMPRHHDLLVEFVRRPNEVLTKDHLLTIGWPKISVTQNNLVKAITHLREELDAADPEGFIKTEPGIGYRWIVPVTVIGDALTDAEVDDALAPHLAFVGGRADIETLTVDRVLAARTVLEQYLTYRQDDARYRAALANAYALAFEATRTSATPDIRSLQLAHTHAREACRLQKDLAEAWAVHGYVLQRMGQRDLAVAALQRAVSLEPGNYRHHLRLAAASSGEARLSAARRALQLWPGLPFAHLLCATVYIGRDALAIAEDEVDAGLAAMPDSAAADAPSAAVGLHWIKGRLCLERRDFPAALAAFERELALEARGHIYSLEMAANTWDSIGLLHWMQGDMEAARAAFDQAIARVPLHAFAHGGLALVSGNHSADVLAHLPDTIERAIAGAMLVNAAGDVAGAARAVSAALTAAPDGNAGWIVPIELRLGIDRSRAEWRAVLGLLRGRMG